MDRLHQTFLNILRTSLLGQQLEEDTGLSRDEWARLMDLAQDHHVLPMVFEAVHSLPELADMAFLSPVRQQVRQQVITQTRKTSDFLSLTRRLHVADIRPLVVKGIICRELYPRPDHRISSDEDMLILPEQTLACHQVITDFGMFTTHPSETLCEADEIPYRMETGPLFVELHRSLFPASSEAYGDLNRFFGGVFSRAETLEIQGVPVCTMAPTDHLFYLICHAFKHFLHSGFGIRQVCDIILYANAYGSRIDWQQILDHCRCIHADRFAAALFRIGEKHLVFDPEKACYPPVWQQIVVDEVPMLEDLLSSGLYGSSSMSRMHSSSITLNAVAARKQDKKTGNTFLRSAFPPAKNLEKQYPYLKDHPYLLPAAWVTRLFRYRRESGAIRYNSASDALKIGNRRIALLKEYGIIE